MNGIVEETGLPPQPRHFHTFQHSPTPAHWAEFFFGWDNAVNITPASVVNPTVAANLFNHYPRLSIDVFFHLMFLSGVPGTAAQWRDRYVSLASHEAGRIGLASSLLAGLRRWEFRGPQDIRAALAYVIESLALVSSRPTSLPPGMFGDADPPSPPPQSSHLLGLEDDPEPVIILDSPDSPEEVWIHYDD